MSDENNFLEQINEEQKLKEQKSEEQPLESFKAETFVSSKYKPRILPYVVVILLVIITITSYYFFTNEKVIVVDFSGMELEQVETWSELNAVMLLSQQVFDPLIDEGLVINQNLEIGYSMKPEDTLVIKISSGPNPYELLELPNFDESWSKTAIQAWLESNKVNNFAFKYIDNKTVEGDYLIDFILVGAKEDSYSRSASIEFVFSQPEDGVTVIMPNFLGDSIASFDAWANAEGFTYVYTQNYSDIYDENQIMKQNFTPNREKLLTDILEVVISKGISNEKVIMENLVNIDISEAQAWIVEKGLTISTIKKFNDNFSEDRVIEQNIQVGEEILIGSNVELIVSVGEAVSVPDFSLYTFQNHTLATQIYEGTVLVRQQYDETIPVNQLISQSINRGFINDGNEPIEVIYSLGNNILVPDFRDETISEIDEWIREQNNVGANINLVIIEDENLNEDYGVIFKQNYYNKSIAIYDTLEITVATKKTVPDFSLMTLLEVETFASTCDYAVVIEQKYQLYTNIDEFIWQSVESGTEVNANTLVLVRYSLGMKVIIDDYRGQPLSNFESFIMEYVDQGMNITINKIEQYNDEVPYGIIISQNKFNSTVTKGETIDVIVSLGESYFVQKFTGYSRNSIEDLADNYGLNIVFIEEESDMPLGTVIKQSIEPETTISRNEFIYITIAK